jgi:hypothetical protein
MWQIVRKQTRPSTAVPFFNMGHPSLTASFKQYWQETYVLTDKLIYVHVELSEDMLDMYLTMIWDSRESIDAMIADERVNAELLDIKKAFLEEHGSVEIVESNQEV